MENFEGFEGAAEIKNSVKNIMHAAQQISEGFGDMKKDVEEILAEKAIDSDDSQQKSPGIVPLTAAKITEWNSALKQIFSDMEGCNPILDRSLKFKSLTSGVSAPYDEMLKDVRQKARQTGPAQFPELLQEGKVPTTSTSESQTSEVKLTDVRLSTSSSSAESVPPTDATCQASLSLTISWSLLTLIHCQ